VILDINMPGTSGFDVCTAIRARGDVPVMMLTARGEEQDLVKALDLGADDYLTKPYSPRELMARVRTLLRRTATVSGPAGDGTLTVGALRIDPVRHEIEVDGRPIDCTPAEFELLRTMAAQPGRAFTRRQLLEDLHGFDRYITERTVDTHVMNLRKKIEPDTGKPTRLVTVYGIGYKLADRAS